jgi:hypothetical protein
MLWYIFQSYVINHLYCMINVVKKNGLWILNVYIEYFKKKTLWPFFANLRGQQYQQNIFQKKINLNI